MILVGSQRGGAGNLARHLLNDRDNDHVTLHELRGVVADDLHGALAEMHAISKATRCTQFMFSLSLNPPKGADASIDDLMRAADQAEKKLGLDGQPRAVVVHEKEGRRHIHVVWSRIDADTMKAVNLPFFKERLATLSKELYLDHGWDLPEGHRENGWKNPLNFTLAEWQQAKRIGLDPREIRQVFRDTWEHADGLKSFRAGLEHRGYFLARGDRRGFVAVDVNGEVFSVSRQIGIRTKELEQRLGSPDGLENIERVQRMVRDRMAGMARENIDAMRTQDAQELLPVLKERAEMLRAQREERKKLAILQSKRQDRERAERQARFRTGVRGVWDLLSGRARHLRRENEREAFLAWRRDVDQREFLFSQQMEERRALGERISRMRLRQRTARMAFIGHMIALTDQTRDHSRRRDRGMELTL